jgi:hypothetical protein
MTGNVVKLFSASAQNKRSSSTPLSNPSKSKKSRQAAPSTSSPHSSATLTDRPPQPVSQFHIPSLVPSLHQITHRRYLDSLASSLSQSNSHRSIHHSPPPSSLDRSSLRPDLHMPLRLVLSHRQQLILVIDPTRTRATKRAQRTSEHEQLPVRSRRQEPEWPIPSPGSY